MHLSAVVIIVIILWITMPVAYIVSEFVNAKRKTRTTLACLAILCCMIGPMTVFRTTQTLSEIALKFNYNAKYGSASHKLINAIVEKLELGGKEQVLTSLKKLQEKFQPTYENDGNYEALIDETVKQLKSGAQHDIFSGIPNIPVLNLETTNVVEIFRYLQDYADKNLPKDKRIEIILNLPVKDFPRYPKRRNEDVEPIQSVPDMTPVNISFKDALKYICRAANLMMGINGRKIIISQSDQKISLDSK